MGLPAKNAAPEFRKKGKKRTFTERNFILAVILSFIGSYSCEFNEVSGLWGYLRDDTCVAIPWGSLNGELHAARAFAIITTLSGVYLVVKGFLLLICPRITGGAEGKCLSCLLFFQVLFEGLKFLGLGSGFGIGVGGDAQIVSVVFWFIALVLSFTLKEGEEEVAEAEEPLLEGEEA